MIRDKLKKDDLINLIIVAGEEEQFTFSYTFPVSDAPELIGEKFEELNFWIEQETEYYDINVYTPAFEEYLSEYGSYDEWSSTHYIKILINDSQNNIIKEL